MVEEKIDLCMIQETKSSGLSRRAVGSVWGDDNFDWLSKNAAGLSGGLICVWKADLLEVMFSFSGDNFIGMCAKAAGRLCYFVNVYSACNMAGKRRLWINLKCLKEQFEIGDWCIAGDFNAVISRQERSGCTTSFNQVEASEFLAFMEDMELIDVPVLGKKYTCFGSDGRASRLDRILLSEDLISRWGISAQWVGNREISDHCPVWLISSELNWGPKPFRFNNCWVDHKDFNQFVHECWASFKVEGRGSYVIKEKLRLLKEKLKIWNREVFGVKDLNIENIVRDLNEVERLSSEGGCVDDDQRRKLNNEFWRELHAKESLLAQKSRVRWLAQGDSNSRYFHACMKNNRRRTQLLKVMVNDEWVEDVDGVKRAVRDHFEAKFKEEEFVRPTLDGVIFNQIDNVDNELLVMPFSLEEVKEAVWECDGNKSPGLDGFNFTFIKNCWDLVSPEIMRFFEEFHRQAKLPKAISASFLALIPKCSNPNGLGEYRPISLIGCLYKMLAKVLAGRFKKVLKGVISVCQSAFLAGRNILDGVLVVNEIMDMAKRRKQKCVVLKADFEKAYDSVSWSYLDYMLGRLGFGAKWRGWMRTCFSSNSISVLVNGSPS